MPYIQQICNKETITPDMAEWAWNDLAYALQGIFGLKTTDYYGGSADFTTSARIGGRDMVFVVCLHDTPIRTKRDKPDLNAKHLTERVASEMVARGYPERSIGVLLHHGKSGWGETSRHGLDL